MLLPAPLAPTIATILFAEICKLKSLSANRSLF